MRWWRWAGFFLLTVCFMVLASSTDLSIGQVAGGGMVGSALRANSSYYLSPAGSFLLWFFIFLIGAQLACNISWLTLSKDIFEKARPLLKKARLPKSITPKIPESLKNKIPVSFPSLNLEGLKARGGRVLSRLSALATTLKEKIPGVKTRGGGAPDSPEIVAPSNEESFNISPNNDNRPNMDLDMSHPEDMSLPDSETEESTRLYDDIKIIPPGSSRMETAETGVAATPPLSGKPEPVQLPSPALLNVSAGKNPVSREILQEKGRALMACFNNFDVKGELVKITPGPVVTMYEVRPAPGVRVSKIANLADDLSLALKAVSVRIQAPLPGTDRVGIELPNDERETVNFRELVETEEFRQGCGPLTMILGRDIAGAPCMTDLASMPHLLVAGSTGAGKSVCLNSIIISLLYRLQPEQMQLMLIDPKRIEMSVYADLPHLVHPVVTEMSDAKAALDWAVHEMMRRYDIMKPLGARNITAYNKKIEAMGDHPLAEYADATPLPYLVIIIDELADLMMTAAREVEASIVRLGQLARAAGIHMILATQRPSVDVVTSLIKTNMSGRISFKVTSKYDSRTILDQNGAEQLLGKGDMLFKPPTTSMRRLHGPFLSDEEVATVVNYWKEKRAPGYAVDFSQWSNEKGAGSGGGDASDDPIYEDAKAYVIAQGSASISRLQRQFQIGFNRAGRLVDQFERDGIVGPALGSKPRKVINK